MNPKNFLGIILLIISMANLNSQDYTLNFNGVGASNKIDTIIVKNLTQGTSLIKPDFLSVAWDQAFRFPN
jgi:hypothetical protein